MNLSLIAEKLNDEKIYVKGNSNIEINRIASPEDSDEKSLCIIWDKKALENLDINIPIAAPQEFFEAQRNGIICENPRALLPKFLEIFNVNQNKITGIDERALISPEAIISPNVTIYAGAFIGEGCVIGEGTVVEANAVLLKNVKVGKNCLIHSGAVIGCDGFGFAREKGNIIKIPQNGGVFIGDDVEIGANTTIDRGTIENTTIGSQTKIDNLVMIGHNCKIGKACTIVSQVGIAGSCTIGDRVVIAGQAGLKDHVEIGDDSIILAKAGITKSFPKKSVIMGAPAVLRKDFIKRLKYLDEAEIMVQKYKKYQHLLEDYEKFLNEDNKI